MMRGNLSLTLAKSLNLAELRCRRQVRGYEPMGRENPTVRGPAGRESRRGPRSAALKAWNGVDLDARRIAIVEVGEMGSSPDRE